MSSKQPFRRAALVSGALTLGLAQSLMVTARAQEDPIGALLDKSAIQPSQTPPPQTAPVASPPAEAMPTNRDATPATIPPAPAPVSPQPAAGPAPQAITLPPAGQLPIAPLPYAPQPYVSRPYVPPKGGLSTPMRIEETGKAPDGPPSPSDLYFESRVRQSFAAAQGMQGPLDGHWVVRSGGMEIFDLQLVDRNQGTVEGAWRDPRRGGAVDASGFIDTIQRVGGELTVRFQPRTGADPVQLSLRALGDGWTGELIERGDRKSVTVRRN